MLSETYFTLEFNLQLHHCCLNRDKTDENKYSYSRIELKSKKKKNNTFWTLKMLSKVIRFE